MQFFTFDVIGDLAYGESFDCLASGQYHPWITLIFSSSRFFTYFRATSFYPSLKRILAFFIPKHIIKNRKQQIQIRVEKAMRRLKSQTDRKDFVHRMVRPESGVSTEEFIATTGTLITAGSETTATLLSGVTHLLVTHPQKLEVLVREVRSSFSSEEEITFVSVNKLTYMLACLDEALRLYPPIPGAFPRRTRDPEVILERPVPVGVGVFSIPR